MTNAHGSSRIARRATLLIAGTLCVCAAPAEPAAPVKPAAPIEPAGMKLCQGADGSHLYTQFGCPPGTGPGEPVAQGSLSIITSPGLTDGQRRTLERLEASLTRERQARRQSNARRARQRLDRQAEASARCAEAQSQLARLEAARRRGYSAAEGRRFDAEELKWRRMRRTSC